METPTMNLKPVLYVEDEEDDAFFMRRAFELADILHPLVVVVDGQEAIDYCEGVGRYSSRDKHPVPCILLLDLNLPVRSGLEVLDWLRKQPSYATLPVIVLTSSLQDADIHRAYALGANAYLVKPSKQDELAAMAKAIKNFWLAQNRMTPAPSSLCGNR
jgi:CheY-like chemotaxis protein